MLARLNECTTILSRSCCLSAMNKNSMYIRDSQERGVIKSHTSSVESRYVIQTNKIRGLKRVTLSPTDCAVSAHRQRHFIRSRILATESLFSQRRVCCLESTKKHALRRNLQHIRLTKCNPYAFNSRNCCLRSDPAPYRRLPSSSEPSGEVPDTARGVAAQKDM
jgi:hypothetical protein